jgi:signal transduction histidine kinase
MTSLNDQRVLFVDDDSTIRTSLAFYFRDKAAEFRVLESAEAALKLLQQDPRWDIVVSDYRLPGLDGIAFLKQVLAGNPRVMAALVTAYASVDLAAEAMRAGIHDFIQKPLTTASVTDCLRHLIAKGRHGLQEPAVDGVRLADSPLENWRECMEFLIHKVSHQLNNSLIALRWRAEMGKLKAGAANTLRADFAAILDLLQRVEEINRELVDLGRLSDGESPAPIDLAELIEQCLAAYAAALPAAGIAILRDWETDRRYPVRAVRAALMHVVDNLVLNAIQALGRSEGVRKTIALAIQEQDRRLVLSIRDNGPGMSEAVLRQASRKGFSTRETGKGLGLHIVERLCREIGAEFSLQSREGDGTAAVVRLPRDDAAPAGPQAVNRG